MGTILYASLHTVLFSLTEVCTGSVMLRRWLCYTMTGRELWDKTLHLNYNTKLILHNLWTLWQSHSPGPHGSSMRGLLPMKTTAWYWGCYGEEKSDCSKQLLSCWNPPISIMFMEGSSEILQGREEDNLGRGSAGHSALFLCPHRWQRQVIPQGSAVLHK